MVDLFRALFSPGNFMPHEHCYLSIPQLTWLHVISDLLIGLSYVAISATLVYLVYRGRRDIPFHSMFLAFGTFIVACGGTHFMEIVTVWNPLYWLAGGVKAVTAFASVATAVVLPPLVPVALEMIRAARLSETRRLELQQAHDELTRVHARLKEYDELKTQFFANVSHELRTPLTLILGPSEKLLESGSLSREQQRDLAGIRRNAGILLKHVNDLLDVAKLAAGEMRPCYAQVDLAQLVRLTAAEFESPARERSIRYEVDTPPELPAQVDPEKVERALSNLLSNAFRFTPARGLVRCVLQREEDGAPLAILTVRDSGPGIPPEYRDAVFERFRQVDGGPARQAGGTGLGLAIVRDFVELHGGRVWADAAPEGGAALTIELPVQAPPGAHPEEVSPPVRHETRRPTGSPPSLPASNPRETCDTSSHAIRPESRGDLDEATDDPRSAEPATAAETSAVDDHRPLVLVVEDNVDMRGFITSTLEEEFRTEVAADGEEGAAKARELRPDLILSDVMMPRMSGDEMVRVLRSEHDLDGTPMVLLTAREEHELRVRMLREGAQDYLTKPFSAEELRARVHNLVRIRRARAVLQSELASREADIEVLAREVSRHSRDLQGALDAAGLALEHAESASRVKTNFLRMVSHELRTPLTGLKLQIQLLERDASLSPRQVEILRKVTGSAGRLEDLIESVLEHTRIESGRLVPEPETIEPGEFAADALDEMRGRAEQKGLELRLGPLPADLPTLRTDRRILRLILMNLLENAIKYTGQGLVELSVEGSPEGHRISVRDTGPGIAPEYQSLIWEPFEQLEPVRQKHTPGFGLGLTLVREMVEALGGRIELTSTVGAGSTFHVLLPPVTQ